ncbi:MAG: tetratricopeptide repeat protein [Deltaproteobacteria bacterium]|nr:tetratricopeptide repeat protein [Deltaproteobacteria bacterium]
MRITRTRALSCSVSQLLDECVGDARGAEPAFRQAVDIRRRKFGPAHFSTANAQIGLGARLLDLGHYVEAETLLLGILRVIVTQEPTHQHEKGRILGQLVKLYQALDRPEEAASYQALLSHGTSRHPRSLWAGSE